MHRSDRRDQSGGYGEASRRLRADATQRRIPAAYPPRSEATHQLLAVQRHRNNAPPKAEENQSADERDARGRDPVEPPVQPMPPADHHECCRSRQQSQPARQLRSPQARAQERQSKTQANPYHCGDNADPAHRSAVDLGQQGRSLQDLIDPCSVLLGADLTALTEQEQFIQLCNNTGAKGH